MTTDLPPCPPGADVEHRGWTLQTTWFRSSLGVSEGWVCFATRPTASHRVNIGRWTNSDLALEHGRAYVDRRMDKPELASAKLAVQQPRR
ncbi:hypothetical protein [Ramlibacter pallidus]|uniref:Uncharacterized protein n=1 Tax=Ramlibacter pallidus TaxID=2780087 RepID=A0ABR9S5Y0_9BURK|nr:hypothetical protein [Ramlibacter pallidus]MBE7368919.1 hypothetical protein [Ramlibacter pallidus]